jgi:hypothetical protein
MGLLYQPQGAGTAPGNDVMIITCEERPVLVMLRILSATMRRKAYPVEALKIIQNSGKSAWKEP